MVYGRHLEITSTVGALSFRSPPCDHPRLFTEPCRNRILRSSLIEGLRCWCWAAPVVYDVFVTWATRVEGPSCQQKRTRPYSCASWTSLSRGRTRKRPGGSSYGCSGSPPPALGRPPPQERLAGDPPDSGGCMPRLVSGRPYPRAGAAHVRPDSGGYRAGAGGGRTRPAGGRADARGGFRSRVG